MGMVYLGLFALAEILLVILTFTKFQEKAAWRKNKMIIRAAETVILLGIIILPTVYLKWRFFAALGLVAVRFIFAGIMWLVKHKKAEGLKKKGWSVVNGVVSIILAAIALLPSVMFSNYNGLPTTGSYIVAETSAILVDKNRTDPFETDGSFREVPVHFYYPENADGVYPLVVFSHGAFGYYQSNFSTDAELASNGYIVAALDHPHHSFFTKDTDGKIVTVDPDFINDVIKINEQTDDQTVYDLSQSWMKLRTDDENFVLDTIENAKSSGTIDNAWHTDEKDAVISVLSHTDTEKIGLIGHSLGGAASTNLGRKRNDVDTVIVLDGTMLGEVKGIKDGKNVYYDEPYPVPLLDFTKKKDYDLLKQYKNEHGYPYVNEYVDENALDSKIAIFDNAEHMDFTDLPMFSPFLGSMLGHGDVDSVKMMTDVNGVVLDWFNYYLKGEGVLDIQAQY